MNLQLAGYEIKSRQQFQRELTDYSRRVAIGDLEGMPPTAATPVFADGKGQHFIGIPTEDGVVTLPFIPGSPARGDQGGFVPAEQSGKANGKDDVMSMLGGIAGMIPPEAAASWLAVSAANATLAGAPGTPMAAALAALGMPNPMAAGALGGAVAAAANVAGLGRAGSLLGSAIAAGPQGLANAAGAQALAGLVGQTPLNAVPGARAVAGMAGGQISNAASALAGEATAGLDQITAMLGGLLGGNAAAADPGGMVSNIVEGGCTRMPGDGPASSVPDPAAIGAQALEDAADKLLDQWQVDDESSAAEHIAHKLVNDNRDTLKQAAKDPDGLLNRLNKLFFGEASGAILPAARLKDTDITKPEVIAKGVATILAEGQPISRITDPLAPSGAMILEGAATVLSAGLPTARVTSKTDSPGVMIEKGAPTVLVGGPSAAVDPPDAPPDADPAANDGPDGPDAPESPTSESSSSGDETEGSESNGQNDDSTSGATEDLTEESQTESPEESDLHGKEATTEEGEKDRTEPPKVDTEQTDSDGVQPTSSPADGSLDPCEGGVVVVQGRDDPGVEEGNKQVAEARGHDLLKQGDTPERDNYCDVVISGHASDKCGVVLSERPEDIDSIMNDVGRRAERLEIGSCGSTAAPYHSVDQARELCEKYGIPVTTYTDFTVPGDDGKYQEPRSWWCDPVFCTPGEADSVTASPNPGYPDHCEPKPN
jgi:hypothetical protein